MTDSYVIIGGANKSGTTSLFRYHADHPEVYPSRIKETDFFAPGGESVDSLRTKYESLFQGCSEGAKVRLEASPEYMTEGARLVERMQQILPTAKLIFYPRDPVNRILSRFQRNKQSQFEKGMAMLSIHEFVDLLEEVVADSGSVPSEGVRRNVLLQFNRGCYANYLREHRKCFPNDQMFMFMLMFDDLVGQPRNIVQDVCRFIGVNEDFYSNYQFQIENQSRQYRLPMLQKTGSRLGKTFEGVINRAPYVRYALRKILLSPHAVPKNSEVCQSVYSRIESLYRLKRRKILPCFLRACIRIWNCHLGCYFQIHK